MPAVSTLSCHYNFPYSRQLELVHMASTLSSHPADMFVISQVALKHQELCIPSWIHLCNQHSCAGSPALSPAGTCCQPGNLLCTSALDGPLPSGGKIPSHPVFVPGFKYCVAIPSSSSGGLKIPHGPAYAPTWTATSTL